MKIQARPTASHRGSPRRAEGTVSTGPAKIRMASRKSIPRLSKTIYRLSSSHWKV